MRGLTTGLLLVTPLVAQVVPAPRKIETGRDAACTGTVVQCEVRAFAPQAAAFVNALQKLGVDRASVATQPHQGAVVRIVEGRSGGECGEVGCAFHLGSLCREVVDCCPSGFCPLIRANAGVLQQKRIFFLVPQDVVR